ncbi:hypothetical protein KQH65_06395 [archaeon]|nr:hypothetical protein [archaeon]
MSAPYDFKKITPSVYGDRRPVEGETVALLHISFDDRGLKLIETKSRTVKRNEIHELMITDEAAAPGGGADRVRAIGFFEITESGLIVAGDEVFIEDRRLGTLVGYDVTHMPNHINVVVRADSLDEPVLRVGDRIRFRS